MIKDISVDERYPVYYLIDGKSSWNYYTDIPDDILEKIAVAEEEYNKWQDYLSDRWDEAKRETILKKSTAGQLSKGF